MIVLLVDAQKSITNHQLYAFDTFVSQVRELLRTARDNGIEVIYVRHNDGVGGELEKGTDGYEIFDAFQPKSGEKIMDKTANSAFKDTMLAQYLHEQHEHQLMIAGLQTDYCMDATIKSGFERGIAMIVPAHCNTTVDNEFMSAEQSYRYYNEKMWKDRYATCIPYATAVGLLQTR